MWINIENIPDDATDDVAFCKQEANFVIVLSGFSLYSVDTNNLTDFQLDIARKNYSNGYVYDIQNQKLIKQH